MGYHVTILLRDFYTDRGNCYLLKFAVDGLEPGTEFRKKCLHADGRERSVSHERMIRMELDSLRAGDVVGEAASVEIGFERTDGYD